ncbi:MAG: carboxypeptidase-like regulatory domain-containing protein [Planctomycetes bacterium]|nr:carboxypeptidase-like regulatory domain-containing protein [Planctomycetota bacterium]
MREPESIHGTVVDCLGAPIAGAVVQLRRGDEVVADTKSEARGAFVFRSASLAPSAGDGPPLLVHASASAMALAVDVVEAERHPVVLCLVDGATLRARVTDEHGSPLGGVPVVARHVDNAGQAVEARTAVDGSVELGHVPLGRVLVLAWISGRQLMRTIVDVRGDAECSLVLPPARERWIRIRVHGVQPEQWAQARCSFQCDDHRIPHAWLAGGLDTHGEWIAAGLPGDIAYYNPQVQIPGLVHRMDHGYWPEHALPGMWSWDVSMQPEELREIEGVVVDETGAPLGGAVLRTSSNRSAGGVVVADADGRFRTALPLVDGDPFSFELDADDRVLDPWNTDHYRSPRCRTAFLAELPLRGPLRLSTVPAAVVRGRCVHHDGAPAVGHHVVLEVRWWPTSDREHTSQLAVVPVAADGSFVFARRNARLGAAVSIRVQEQSAGRSEEFLLREGGVVDVPVLVLPPLGEVCGVVRDAAGGTLPGRTVTVACVAGEAGQPEPQRWWRPAITDRHGRFRLVDVPPGTWRLAVVSSDDVASWRGEPFVLAAGEHLQRDLREP